ncbi:MAG: hypothetical protein ACRCXN_13040 [Bacteroidales bacterium]
MIVFVPINPNGVEGQPFVNEADALEYIAGLASWTVGSKNIPDIILLPDWNKLEEACWGNQAFISFILNNAVPNGYTTLVATIQNGKRGEAIPATLEKCINEFIGVTFPSEHLSFLNTALSDNYFPFTI